MLLAAIGAGTSYFALVFACGFVLGTLRVFVIVPRLGATAGVLLEAPAMLAISWVVCRWCVRRFGVPGGLAPNALMGGTAFALLTAAEFVVAALVFGWSAAEYLRGFATMPGVIGLAAQAAFAVFPLLQRGAARVGRGSLHAR